MTFLLDFDFPSSFFQDLRSSVPYSCEENLLYVAAYYFYTEAARSFGWILTATLSGDAISTEVMGLCHFCLFHSQLVPGCALLKTCIGGTGLPCSCAPLAYSLFLCTNCCCSGSVEEEKDLQELLGGRSGVEYNRSTGGRGNGGNMENLPTCLC